MKKYLLGIVAIVLAITFSAFTIKPSFSNNTTQRVLYWYFIDGSGNIGAQVNGGTAATKDEVFDEVNCFDVSGPDCARGYESTQTFGLPAPSPSSNDDHIMKDND